MVREPRPYVSAGQVSSLERQGCLTTSMAIPHNHMRGQSPPAFMPHVDRAGSVHHHSQHSTTALLINFSDKARL